MNTQNRWWLRIGVLTDLVARSRTKLGRTALMKLTFLLQTVEGVPLGYNFRLYTYGPFDEDVLHDLSQAESMQAVVSTMVPFSGGDGYGYEFASGSSSDLVRGSAAEFITPYQDKIRLMIERFGDRNAADLELLSTIVYADRDCQGRTPSERVDELANRVREIKPRFSIEHIKENIRQLGQMGLLQGFQSQPASSDSACTDSRTP